MLLIADVEITVGSDTSNHTIEQVKSMLIQDGKRPYMKRPGSGNHLVSGARIIGYELVSINEVPVTR